MPRQRPTRDQLLLELRPLARRHPDTDRKPHKLAVLRRFAADLSLAREAYAIDQQIGCEAAALAALHLCWSLGLQDFAVLFRTMAQGFEALREGQTPSVFRKGPREE